MIFSHKSFMLPPEISPNFGTHDIMMRRKSNAWVRSV
jgi:hypothetical protein